MTERDTWVGEYLAGLPYMVGHELGDEHVVVGAFANDGRVILHGAVEWNPLLEGQESVRATAGHLGRALRTSDVGRLIVVGYGPQGRARAQRLSSELEPVVGATSLQVHVQDGAWRMRDDALAGRWGPARRVPEGAPDMVLQGKPQPAASREAAIRSVAPLEAPLFEPLEQSEPKKAARLRDASPALRADVATGTLSALAAGLIDDPERMQVLAHLVGSDLLIRDAALSHAVRDEVYDDRVAALVRTFRAAPLEQQPALASTAAAAAFLAAWPPPVVRGLLKYADTSNELASLVTTAVDAGVSPHVLRPGMAERVDVAIREADDAWTAGRPRERRPESGSPARPAARQGSTWRPPRPTRPPQGPADGPGL